MPATSPSDCSSNSARKPFLSQYLRYMRSSIDAQSCASVPPAPAWMSMKQLFGSSGLENMRRNSSVPTSFSSFCTSIKILERVASSFSARASSNSSLVSAMPPSTRFSVSTTASRDFFSLPISCARCWLAQSLGSSSSLFRTARRCCLASKSKIPPQLGRLRLQPGERRGNLIDAFCFHDRRALYPPPRVFLVDLVVEERGGIGRRHEAPVDLGIDLHVLVDLPVGQFHLERHRLLVVADRAQLRGVDALSLHCYFAALQAVLVPAASTMLPSMALPFTVP